MRDGPGECPANLAFRLAEMSASNSGSAVHCLRSAQWVMIAARSAFGSEPELITIPIVRDLIVRLDGLLSAITRSDEYRTALLELACAHPYLGGIVVRYDAGPCAVDRWTDERCRRPDNAVGGDAWEMGLSRVIRLREAIGLAGAHMLERDACIYSRNGGG